MSMLNQTAHNVKSSANGSLKTSAPNGWQVQ
jgi:hypothetical protein